MISSRSIKWIQRSCDLIKKGSIEWAIIRATRDVKNTTVDEDAYRGPDLEEEKQAYWKTVRDLDEIQRTKEQA